MRCGAFVNNGGTLVAIGSSGETARTLLSLPVERVVPPSPFAIPGSLMRVRSAEDVPEMWGMPREWTTWSDGDTGYRITDASKAKAGSTYPERRGAAARRGLRGRIGDAAARERRHRHVRRG